MNIKFEKNLEPIPRVHVTSTVSWKYILKQVAEEWCKGDLSSLFSKQYTFSHTHDTQIVWNPHHSLFAYSKDSKVFLYDLESSAWFPHSEYGLHHERQGLVSCMRWKPNAGATLAVGSEFGIFLWKLCLLNGKLEYAKTGHCRILSHPSMSLISSLEWSPNGEYLVAGTELDSCLYICDASTNEISTFGRGLGSPTTGLYFSPDGSFLIQTCSKTGFRVWETVSWTSVPFDTRFQVESISFLHTSNMLFLSQGSQLSCFKLNLGLGSGLGLPKIELLNVPCSFEKLDSKILKLELSGQSLLVVTMNQIHLFDILMNPLPKLQQVKVIKDYEARFIGISPEKKICLLEKDNSISLK